MRFFNKNIKLILILVSALLIRISIPLVSFIAYHDAALFYEDDSNSYLQPAKEMLARGTFTDGGRPVLFRTPGYPIFLIPGILFQSIELITIALQIIIGTATVFLIYRLALLLFGNTRIALAAAFLYALEPLAIGFCGFILSETLFSFVFVVFLYSFFIFLKRRSWLSCILSAVFLSATAYVRPITLYLGGALFVAGSIYYLFKRDKKTVLMLLAFTAVAVSLNGVWIVRNGLRSGYYGFSAVTDVNLYSYQASAVLAVKSGTPYYDMMAIQNKKLAEYQQEHHLTEAQTLAYMRKEGTATLLKYPAAYLVIHLKGMATVAFTPGAVDILKELKLYPRRGGLIGRIVDEGLFPVLGEVLKDTPVFFWTLALLFIQLLFYYFLAISHFFSKNRMLFPFTVFLLLIMAYFWFVSGGPHAVDRFRHPLMPLVCLFAGSGWVFFMDKISARVSAGIFGGKEKRRKQAPE